MRPWRGRRRLAALLIWALATGVQAAPGSWVANAPSIRLFTPGRIVDSAPLMPPAILPEGARITSVRWRFTLPSVPVEAWLCHPRRCISLEAFSRRSDALSGLAAEVPLFFRFRLPRNARLPQPAHITQLQAIIGYR